MHLNMHGWIKLIRKPQTAIRLQSNISRFYRGIEAINWMLKYRWIISVQHEKAEAEPYYFSLVSELFDYVALEVYSADKKVFKGFLILSVLVKKGRTWLKILDFAFKDPTDSDLRRIFRIDLRQEVQRRPSGNFLPTCWTILSKILYCSP